MQKKTKKIALAFLVFIFFSSFIFYNKSLATPPPTSNSKTENTGSSGKGSGFGGKIIKDKIENVKCNGGGKILVLSRNISGLIQSISSQASDSDTEKVVGGASGAYKAIPFYITPVAGKDPKVGGLILGTAKRSPDMSICKLEIGEKEIPFPVREVLKYGVSKPR